jgi:signal transduction histidine kinase
MITVNRTAGRVGLGVLLLVAVFLTQLDLVQHYTVDPPLAFVLGITLVSPLLLLRRQPLVAWLLELTWVVATAVGTYPSTEEPWPLPVSSTGVLVAMSLVAVARGERRLTIVMLSVLGLLALVTALVAEYADPVMVVVSIALCAGAVVVGDVVHGRRRAVTELTEERQVSATERERRTLVEERARIARELHDVVAHHMSMITVQAETARYRLDPLPDHVADEFTGIAALARSSLTELRGLLSAMRDETADADLAPQPTLADLPALVERIVAAGTPVTLTVAADLPEIPDGVALSAYRIVQEALSNVVRHAGGVPTTVLVGVVDERLLITVTNAAPAVARPIGTGFGLRGLRERAALMGGTLEVDQPDGGWRVWAELPI